MTEISPVVLDQIRRQYHATKGRSEKKKVVEQAASHYGVSYATMNRKLDMKLRKRAISQTEQERIATLDAYGKAVWDFMQLHTHDDKKCTMRAAFRHLQATAQLPGDFDEKQCYAAIERQHLNSLSIRPYIRFEREHALSCYQIDFTKSNFLRFAGNNTIVMTDGRYGRGEDELYVWLGGAIDDRTRVMYYEYILTPGENAMMAQQFIIRAMDRKEGMMLLQGKPREIYVDRGPGFEAASTGDGLMRLGVKHIKGDDFRDANGKSTGQTNKQARGKIEKMNGFVKSDFEQSLHLKYRAGYKFTLSELNTLLQEWCEWQNQQEHPEHVGEGKWNVFSAALSEAAFPDYNALAKFSKPILAKVARRLVRVAKNEYYLAPQFIGEGERVEVTKRQDGAYVVWKGSEIKLVPQQSPYAPKAHQESRKELIAKLEEESDIYDGILLRERFDKELKTITNGDLALATLPVDERTELKTFFAEPRKLSAIKECADNVKLRVLIPRQLAEAVAPKAAEPNAVLRSHPKVIHYQPTL